MLFDLLSSLSVHFPAFSVVITLVPQKYYFFIHQVMLKTNIYNSCKMQLIAIWKHIISAC